MLHCLSVTPEEREIADTIKELRLTYGETQEQFSKRLGVTVRTIARYELERPPTGKVLGKLLNLASDIEREDFEDIFRKAFRARIYRRQTLMGENIKLLRTALGLTQQELAQRTGLSIVTIARYEAGSGATAEVLNKLAAFAREQNLSNFADVFEGRAPVIEFYVLALETIFRERFPFFSDTPDYRRMRIFVAVSMVNNSTLTELERLLAPQLVQVDEQISEQAEKIAARPINEDQTPMSEEAE